MDFNFCELNILIYDMKFTELFIIDILFTILFIIVVSFLLYVIYYVVKLFIGKDDCEKCNKKEQCEKYEQETNKTLCDEENN